ncbi:Uncharacterised protein [Mycobacterium tuberculosis]|nr:Uncharacterised protein [Mycobacterium tuberculosis]
MDLELDLGLVFYPIVGLELDLELVFYPSDS